MKSSKWRGYNNDVATTDHIYNKIGQLTSEKCVAENRRLEIFWTPYGKVDRIYHYDATTGSFMGAHVYIYDGMGNQVTDLNIDNHYNFDTTYHIYDANNTQVALYHEQAPGPAIGLTRMGVLERYLYGSDKLGVIKGTNQVASLGWIYYSSGPSTRKYYELHDHLGNTRVVLSAATLPAGTAPSLANYYNYYAFGSYEPGRAFEPNMTYAFGFNGKMKKDDWRVPGGSYDYGMRNYNARIGRAISIDPLASKFPMLSVYQFFSNSPIVNVDLDGNEGISYRVMKKDAITGAEIAIKRVIELDIHIAVNNLGTKGAYTPKEAKNIENIVSTKYNEKKYKDEAGLEVEFRFNFVHFNPKEQPPTALGEALLKQEVTSKYTLKGVVLSNGSKVNVPTMTAAVMFKEKIKDAGLTDMNIIRINPQRGMYDLGYSETHETGHFMLRLCGQTDQSPEKTTNEDHDLGGFMKWGISSMDDVGKLTIIQPVVFDFMKTIFDKIIVSVPRVADKAETYKK